MDSINDVLDRMRGVLMLIAAAAMLIVVVAQCSAETTESIKIAQLERALAMAQQECGAMDEPDDVP